MVKILQIKNLMTVILVTIIILALCSLEVYAQKITVSGIVKSENDELLPGASIIEKGTTNGTVTNAEGKFNLSVSTENAVLVISFIGMKSQEIEVGNQTDFNVVLIYDISTLDEVVIVEIGYSSIDRKDLVGSVSSVTAKQLKDFPAASTATALQGRLAGVQITSVDGAPGAEMVIRVRGGSSITQDNSPLYIVDGVQVEDALSTISPQDIASIDVLKDASSTAIYGARGANGVVIITTKGGKAGKSQVSYNGSMGFKELPSTLDVLRPYDFIVWQYERSRGNNTDQISFANTYGTTFDTLSVYQDLPFINWQEKTFGKKAGFQNHNISVSGGNDLTTFNLSLTANKEDGIQLESGFNRYLMNFKLDHKVSEKLKVGLTARYNDQVVKGAGTIDPGTREASRMRHAINYRPFELPKVGYGEDDFDEAYFLSSRITNPVIMTKTEYKRKYSKGIYLIGYFNYNILKNLTLRSTIGIDNVNVGTDKFFSKISSTARRYANMPVASIDKQQINSINNSNTLQYSLNNVREHHDISLLVGQEIVQVKSNGNYVETRYFPEDISAEKALGNMGLGAVPTGSTASQPLPSSFVATPSRLFSFFGRASYAYDDKFFFNFTTRADRSSKFTPDNSLLISPSGSIGWRISGEKFMENLSWISDAKLRYGYGIVGNNRIDNNLYVQLYGVTASYALNHSVLPGFAPTALANPDLRWERNTTQNLGLDLSLFKNDVQLTVDFYRNTSNDLLLEVLIPPTSGYTKQIQNVGSTSNSGIEIQVSAVPVSKKDFTWTSNFNIGYNKNRIENLGGVDLIERQSGWQVGGGVDFIVKVGEPVGQMYGFITDGFYTVDDFDYDPTTQAYTLKEGVADNSTVFSSNPQPGMLKFKDLTGDGIVDDLNDKTIIGDANPKFTGGWNNQFSYKNFDLSVFVNFVYGNNIYNANKIEFTQGDFINVNVLNIMKDRWTNIDANGVVIKDPAELAALNANAKIWSPVRTQRWPLHTWAVEDGSYLRINNITLGYTLPKNILNKIMATNFRVFGTVNNLATLTNYTGFDPDVSARRTDPLTPGVDFAAYPHSIIWTVGLNITY